MSDFEQLEPSSLYESMPKAVKYVTPRARQRVAKWRDPNAPVEGCSTGFITFDDAGIRLVDGELIVIGARPGMGKTAVATQMAEHVATVLQAEGDTGCVMFYSCEMSGDDLLLRMAASNAHVNLQAAKSKLLPPDQYDDLEKHLDRLDELPIIISDASSPDTAKIFQEIQGLKRQGKPVRLLVFDYLELLEDSTITRAPMHEKIGSIIKRLKAFAKHFRIPVVVLCQLTREVEAAGRNMMPNLSDLRGSALIEQTADKVFFLMRPQYYLANGISCVCTLFSDAKDIIYVSNPKDRNGVSGRTFRFRWADYRTSMYDIADPQQRLVTAYIIRGAVDVGNQGRI